LILEKDHSLARPTIRAVPADEPSNLQTCQPDLHPTPCCSPDVVMQPVALWQLQADAHTMVSHPFHRNDNIKAVVSDLVRVPLGMLRSVTCM